MHDPLSAQIAERQLDTLEHLLDVDRHRSRKKEEIQPYVALSREAGVGGRTLGKDVAAQLDAAYLNKGILDAIAEKLGTSRHKLKLVDERLRRWNKEAVGWLVAGDVSQDRYRAELRRFMHLSALKRRCVFVGRGVRFLLPPEKGLNVRIIAPRDQRVEHVMKRDDKGRKEAEEHVDRVGAERHAWVKRSFGHEPSDLTLYDLVFNLQHTDHKEVARVIAEQFRRRFEVS